MTLTTNQDKVIVKPDKPVEKVGLIFIPEKYQSTLWSGLVVDIGPGRLNDKGHFIATVLKPGDHILIDTAKAVQVFYENEEYMFTREKEVLGWVEEGGEVLTFKNEGRLTRKEWEETMRRGVVRKTV
jgi:co-chaperonin GroES (HSP10)